MTPVPPHRCMAPTESATLLAECVLVPGEAALTREKACVQRASSHHSGGVQQKAPQQPWWSRGKQQCVGLWDENCP